MALSLYFQDIDDLENIPIEYTTELEIVKLVARLLSDKQHYYNIDDIREHFGQSDITDYVLSKIMKITNKEYKLLMLIQTTWCM